MSITTKLPLLLFFFTAILFNNNLKAQEDSSSIELNIFPNPNSGTFYITLVDHEAIYAKLYSADGRLAKTLYLENGLNYISIQVPTGLYFMRLDEEEGQEPFKIIIR